MTLFLIYYIIVSLACLVTDGTVEGVNFAESDRPRRQDWPGDLVENGMFYFATADLVRERRLQGGRCVLQSMLWMQQDCQNKFVYLKSIDIST